MTTSGGESTGAHPVAASAVNDERSLGAIVGDITKDMSTLVRQEIDLAKTELKQEVSKASKGAGMLGGAGLAGYFTLLFLSVFVMFLLADWFNNFNWAALVVTVLWGIATAVLAMMGKKALKESNPQLPKTQQSLKEDVQWAKAQKS
jgi:uncharacterized membrane protein YqjE